MTIAIVREYAVVNHCTSLKFAPNTFIIVGRATLIVVALIEDRKVPIITTASEDHARNESKPVSFSIAYAPYFTCMRTVALEPASNASQGSMNWILTGAYCVVFMKVPLEDDGTTENADNVALPTSITLP